MAKKVRLVSFWGLAILVACCAFSGGLLGLWVGNAIDWQSAKILGGFCAIIGAVTGFFAWTLCAISAMAGYAELQQAEDEERREKAA